MATALLLSEKAENAASKESLSLRYRQAPANVEAEQALLGAILVNNDVLLQVGDIIRSEHFYEPLHQRIYTAIHHFHDRGLVATPVTLKHFFDQDEALADIGGGHYLAKLAAAALEVINVRDLSFTLRDLALKRYLIGVGEEVVNTAYAQNIEVTALQQVEQAEQKLFLLSEEGTRDKGFRPLKHSIAQAIEHADHAIRRDGLAGVSTGLVDLDRLLGGMQSSDLLILAGRPSMGKTALATSIAYNASVSLHRQAQESGGKPKSVGFFSLEMSSEQLATRILSNATRLNSDKIFKGRISADDFTRLVKESSTLSHLPFFIDDTPALSISGLRTRARRLKRTDNLGMIVVDYLQLLRGSGGNYQNNRVQEVSEITQGLKAIAKELNIPVLALSQLSRAVEQRDDKRPQLSDLRESGTIEQDADLVMFIFREEYYEERKKPGEDSDQFVKWQERMEKLYGLAEVIVAKHRNGPIGTVKLKFDRDYASFRSFDQQHSP